MILSGMVPNSPPPPVVPPVVVHHSVQKGCSLTLREGAWSSSFIPRFTGSSTGTFGYVAGFEYYPKGNGKQLGLIDFGGAMMIEYECKWVIVHLRWRVEGSRGGRERVKASKG